MVIHTPIEYTAQEAVAQGKKLQNDKFQITKDPRPDKEAGARRRIVFGGVVIWVQNAYYT
jgi:hypothetical protein